MKESTDSPLEDRKLSVMASESPFFGSLLSPPGVLGVGGTLFSPHPGHHSSVLNSIEDEGTEHSPFQSPTPTLFASSCKTKKRPREELSVRLCVKKTFYRVIPGDRFRLHPYAVRLIERLLATGKIETLKRPLPPYAIHSEPEDLRRMRRHLSRRFWSAKTDNSNLVEFTEKLLALWGGKLVEGEEETVIEPCHRSSIAQKVSPLARSNRGDDAHRFDDLEDDDLMQLDFLDDSQPFSETLHHTDTADDSWTQGPINSRRVTCYESPHRSRSLKLPSAKKVDESKAKKDKPKTTSKRGMRWTTTERKLFLTGLERWGAGNWKEIHKLIPGRTYVQVKSMGVYLVSKFNMSKGQGPSKAVTDYLLTAPTS